MFIGRESTLASLRGHLDAITATGQGRMFAIRGRRQVGKSALAERFADLSGVPYVFATGVSGGNQQQQLEALTAGSRQSTRPLPDVDLLFGTTPGSWREALGLLELAARTGPLIVVLDEFPWMAKADPTLEAVLQAQWDRALEKMPVLFLLVGSDVSTMEQLSTYGCPLFGRLRPLLVEPLDLGEVSQAFPHLKSAEVIDAFLTVGGFPRLVSDLHDSGMSTTEYVRAAMSDPFSPLNMTGRLVLDAEFPQAPAAAHILSAIGANDVGHARFSDLTAGDTSADASAVSRALATLTTSKRLIDQETPAWAAPSARLRRYRVSDPYLRFWFRYVSDFTGLIERGRADVAIDHFSRDWGSWRGRSVEPLVRQSILRGAVGTPVREVKPWWSRDGQHEFDVVAMDAHATAFVGTIKWRDEGGVTARDIAALAQARSLVPNSGDAKLAAVCPQGTTPAGADLLFTADDIVGAWR